MGEGQRYNQSNHSSTIQRQPAMYCASAIYTDGITIISAAGLTLDRSYQQPAGGEGKEEEEQEAGV